MNHISILRGNLIDSNGMIHLVVVLNESEQKSRLYYHIEIKIKKKNTTR